MAEDGLRLLLVEDNPGDRRLVEESFAEAGGGHVLTSAARLAEAIRLAGDSAFDVALLDLWLPDAQGLDTVRAFRKAAPLLPIIVLTGQSDEGIALETLRAGAQDYIFKSHCGPGILQRATAYALERHRLALRLESMHAQLVHLERSRLLAATAREAAGLMAAPLQTLVNDLARLQSTSADGGLESEDLNTLARAVERLGDIVAKMRSVRHYTTKPYTDGIEIVDFDAAVEDGEDGPP